MGWFKKQSTSGGADAAHIAALEAELSALKSRLDSSEQARIQLEQRIGALDATTATLSAARHDPSDTIVARLDALSGRIQAVDEIAAHVAELNSKVAAQSSVANEIGQLAERLSASDQAIRSTTTQVAAIEQRVASISVELANQINELGHDIDALASAPSAAGAPASADVDTAVLEALKTAQVRLANEQARYEIAFRQDLAALAEQIRRQPS